MKKCTESGTSPRLSTTLTRRKSQEYSRSVLMMSKSKDKRKKNVVLPRLSLSYKRSSQQLRKNVKLRLLQLKKPRLKNEGGILVLESHRATQLLQRK